MSRYLRLLARQLPAVLWLRTLLAANLESRVDSTLGEAGLIRKAESWSVPVGGNHDGLGSPSYGRGHDGLRMSRCVPVGACQ